MGSIQFGIWERDVKYIYIYRYKGVISNVNYVGSGESSGSASWQQQEGKEKAQEQLK